MTVTLDARIWVRGKLNGLAAKLSGRRIGEVQAQKVDCSASLSPFIHLQMPSASPLMVAAPSPVSRMPTTSLKSSITKPARLRSTPINFSENFMEQKSAGFMDAVVGLKMINMAASHSNSRSDLSDDGSFSSGTASPRSGTVSPDPALRVLADAAAPSPQKIDLAFCSRLCDALARDASALRSPTALRIARG